MRLGELFETFIKEDPDSLTGRTVSMSLADLYDMSNTPYPKKQGPNGNFIVPGGKEFYEKKTMKVGGENGVDVEIANGYEQFKAGGSVKGTILKDGESRPYNENNILVDLGWKLAAGTTELVSTWTKGSAWVVDDVINNFTSVGRTHKLITGEDLVDLETAALSGYEKDKQFVLDRWAETLENKTDQSFRDNVAFTSGAVNTVEEIGDLFTGGTGFNLEGAAGIIIGELPSEIVDVVAMTTMGPLAGMATTGALNALEAGGAAAQSITDRVNYAHKMGKLQTTPQYQMYLEGAKEQLISQGRDPSDPELKTEAADLARKQAITMSIQNAFYKVAVTGGVIDAVQNRILYKGPISAGFMRNAFIKGTANTLGEGVSEYAEQVLENIGIIDGAGNITYKTEGAINAAYNGMIASQSGNVMATGTDAAIRAKGGMARFSQFVMGGSKDPKAILDIMLVDTSTLTNKVTTVDENGVRRFSVAELIKERVVTTDQLTDAQKKELKGGLFGIGGGEFTVTKANGETETVTAKQLKENDKNVELISLLDNIEIDPKEGQAVVTLGTEDEVRRMAQLIGVKIDGKPVTNKTKINQVLARLEDVRKIDVRVAGRSTLEAPIYSDLDDTQKMQYWKEGKVDFTGDTERGNQTWSRAQILNNSRRNNDNIPDDVASLEANTVARPSLNDAEYAETRRLQDLIDNSQGLQRAKKELKADQDAWDQDVTDLGREAAVAQNGPRPTADMEGDPYGFNTARNISAPFQTQINMAKAKLKQEQKSWDASYNDTHLTDGSIKKGQAIFDEEFKKKIAIQKKLQADLINANQDAANEAMGYIGPTTPVLDSSDQNYSQARKNVVASTKLKIATADMEIESVQSMLKAHEKVYPGITSEIISNEQLETYKKNPVTVKDSISKEVVENPPENNPQPVMDKPPVGTVLEKDGKSYVWLGAMFAEVKADGARGTTNHQFHKPLLKQFNDSTITKEVTRLDKEAEHNEAPDPSIQTKLLKKQLDKFKEIERNVKSEDQTVIKAPPGVTPGSDNNPNTDGGQARDNTPGSDNNPNTDGGQARDNTPGQDNNPNTDGGQARSTSDIDTTITPADLTGDGAGQDNNPNTDDGEALYKAGEVFDPSAETEIDGQFSDVVVPKSVKDKYADVLATKNGIKIMSFLDGLPPEQAGSLRVNNAPTDTTTTQGDGAGQDNNPNTDGGQTRTSRQGSDNNPNTDGGQTRTSRQGSDNNPNTDGGQTRDNIPGSDNNPNTDGGQTRTSRQGSDNNPNTDGGQARSTSQGSDNNPNTDGGQTRTSRQGSDNNPNTDGGQKTDIKIPVNPDGSETGPKFEPITDPAIGGQQTPAQLDNPNDADEFNIDPNTTTSSKPPNVVTKAPVQPETPKFDPSSATDFTPLDTPKIVGQPKKPKTPKKDVLPGVNPDLVPDAKTGPKTTLTKKQRDAIAGRLDTKTDTDQDDADSIDIDTTKPADDTLNIDTDTKTDTKTDTDTTAFAAKPVVKYTTGKSQIDTKTKKDSKLSRALKGRGGKDKNKKQAILPNYKPLNISDPLKLDKYKSVGKDRGF